MADSGLVQFAYRYLAELLLKCNRAARYPDPTGNMSLTSGRTNVALGIQGLGLTIISKGTGTWTMKFKFGDETTCQFDSTEVNNGDSWELDFADILFTNTAQPLATGPSFYYSWRA